MDEQTFLSLLERSAHYAKVDWGRIDLPALFAQVRTEMPDVYTETEFLERVAFRCGSFVNRSVEYDHLATLILMTLHDRATRASFVDVVEELQDNKDISGNPRPILSDEFVEFIQENKQQVEDLHDRWAGECFLPTLFGWKTLTRAYLMRANGRIAERLTHMMMRVALFIHKGDWERTESCYRDLLNGRYTHATPTLFHSGTRRSQLASCFLPDTDVWTVGGVKKMSEITLGDEVFTHSGRIQPVVQIHSNDRGDRRLYRLYTTDGYVATATEDHQFYCYDDAQKTMGWRALSEMNGSTFVMRAYRESSIFTKGDLDVTSDTQQILSRFPDVCGWILSCPEPTEEYMDVPIFGGVSGVNPKLFRVQAGMIHLTNTAILSDFRVKRKSILQWVLRNGLIEVAQGMMDAVVETGSIRSSDAHLICMILNVFMEGKFSVEDGVVRHRSPTATGCCARMIRKEMVSIDGRAFVRFVRRERALDDETLHRTVYTLGVRGDHSFVVGGVVAKNCFLLGTEDSVSGIFKTISDAAQISKWAGGIGIHVSNIRAKKSYIYGTNGHSNGILPMLKVYNNVSKYIDQCFAPSTLVATAGGMRPISEIREGDLVLNREGVFSPVSKVLTHPWNDRIWNIDGVRVTSEHDFLSPDGEYRSLSDMSIADSVVFPYSRAFYKKDVDTEFSEIKIRAVGLLSKGDSLPVSIAITANLPFPVRVHEGTATALPADADSYVKKALVDAIHIAPEKQRLLLDVLGGRYTKEACFLRCISGSHQGFGRMSVESEKFSGTVYDLEMTGDPSYTTEIGVVHNGGGKRNGAFAMYIEPWHADIYEFVSAKRNAGAEDERARDLFYGLWIPDLFMERIEKDEMWSLFCPAVATGLPDVIGADFKKLYERYEDQKMYMSRVRARDLWAEILRSQIETGTPYMLYKDSCNFRSNQKNLGVIKSSNLCVSGETKIMTDKGYREISTMVDESVGVWNGKEYAPVVVRQTGSDQQLLRVQLSHGLDLVCTPYHHFYVDRAGQTVRVDANELVAGDTIASFQLPRLPENIPPSISVSVKWIMKKGVYSPEYVRLYSSDKDSLAEILYNLQCVGIFSVIVSHATRNRVDSYELRVRRTSSWRRLESRIAPSMSIDNMSEDETATTGDVVSGVYVVAVENLEKRADTFCFTEPLTHKGVFAGILTGQCTEIIEYSDNNEYACCNLASIALPRFVAENPKKALLASRKVVAYTKKDCPFCQLLCLELPGVEKRDIVEFDEEWLRLRAIHAITTVPAVFIDGRYAGGFTDMWKSHLRPVFDFTGLHRVAGEVVENLNRIIDLNVYPVPETEVSNKRHRPIGLGVQGLADVFGALRMAFDEDDARALNREIFETIYHAALESSNRIASRDGPYSTFKGSPLSEGKFHFELTAPVMKNKKRPELSGRYDWEALRISIMEKGVRNSLLVAPMPTASTSQILGNTECFEPWTSNVFLRRTMAGEFYICNGLLQRDLTALGMWDKDTMNRLILAQGSVAKFPIPVYLKNIYRTVWEIPQKSLIDMAVDRQYFIDQSQSLNIFVPEPSLDLLTKIHFYGWKSGLKTGCYYIRSRAPVSAINFGISSPTPATTNSTSATKDEHDEGCVACSA